MLTLKPSKLQLCLAAIVMVLCLGAANVVSAQQHSVWVKRGFTDRLIYTPDAEGDQLPDFSDVGYLNERVNFPAIPSTIILSPVTGDDTPQIQAAIDQVASLPIGANGFRGAVHLRAGTFQIDGHLEINDSGILLRGSGYGFGGTRLQCTGTDRRTIIQISGTGQRAFEGSKRKFVDKVVPVGSRGFRVNHSDSFVVGDRVRITRPAYADWLAVIGMDVPEIDWPSTSKFLRFDRKIVRIEGDRIFVDAPLTNAFELEYGIGELQKYSWPERIQNVGVRNLAIWSSWESEEDEDHPWDAISVDKAENVQILAVNAKYFARSCVVTGVDAKNVTIRRCRFSDPRSQVTGGRRYPFDLGGQMELVTRSRSFDSRHDFIVREQRAPGPHVFHHSFAYNSTSESGPHQRWCNGILFDRILVDSDTLSARNRGDFGTGQGWSGANNVFFNCQAAGYMIQNPPTAQNWLIGSQGPIIEDDTFGPQPPGYYDAHGGSWIHRIPSLYIAQKVDSANLPDGRSVRHRDYLYGDIDGFLYTAGEIDDAPVDDDWVAGITANSNLPVTGFDNLNSDQNFAVTLDFGKDSNEEVIHAWLSIAIRRTSDDLTTDFVRLFTPDDTYKFSLDELNWTGQVPDNGIFVGVIDLGPFLDQMQNGKVNLQISDDIAVDWAKLNLSFGVTTN